MGLLLLAIFLLVLGVLTFIGRGPVAWYMSKEGWWPKEWPWPDKEMSKERIDKYTSRPWFVDYYLIYDGGASGFVQFYRTKFGAHISMFWNYHIASWGGTAKLRRNGE